MPADKKIANLEQVLEYCRRDLYTFGYALTGRTEPAEDMAIDCLEAELHRESVGKSQKPLRSRALKRILAMAAPILRAGAFSRPQDWFLRELCLSHRAVVALRCLLRLAMPERLDILGITEDQERQLWKKAMAMIQKNRSTLDREGDRKICS